MRSIFTGVENTLRQKFLIFEIAWGKKCIYTYKIFFDQKKVNFFGLMGFLGEKKSYNNVKVKIKLGDV
jgi:hypothetical protein